MDEFGLDKDDKFVDIHGREIPTTTVGKKQEVACLLSDLKQTGVGIFQKSQHAKLAAANKDFGPDFVDYMLESAKSYMLANRISFTQDQMMHSIENCKQFLSGSKKAAPQAETQTFLKDRKVEKRSDDEIQIQVSNTPKPPTPIKQKSPVVRTFEKLPRQPPLGRESESESSETENQRVQPPRGKFPKKGAPVEKLNFDDETPEKKSFKGAEEAPKLRPPKKFVYNVALSEHDVIVTSIDKPNCVWVRDIANNSFFDEIHKKVNDEAEYQRVAPKPWQMEKVYMAEDEGVWLRCKVVRYSPLTVFFLDYGNVAQVGEIREVSEELAKMPCMAIRITFKVSQYTPCIEDVIRIQRFMQNADGTFFVNVKKSDDEAAKPVDDDWNSKKPARINEAAKPVDDDWNLEEPPRKIERTPIAPIPKEDPVPVFFKKPQSVCTLQNDQRVVIFQEKDGVFYLRTKEGFEKLKKIEDAIEDYVKNAKSVRNVKLKQLVLCKNPKEGKFCRGVVTKIDRMVKVELLDYADVVSVELGALKAINEELSNEALTYFSGGKLIGFEEEPLDDNCRKLIDEYVKKRKKFTVVLGFDDELDLFDGTGVLSEELQKLEKLPARVSLKDMKPYRPETGVKTYVCGSYKSSTNFALVPSDELKEHIDYVLRSEIDDDQVYIPIVGEVCLCYFVDHWYRCVITRIFEKEYEVLLLDFGNTELIKKEDLRKADDKISEIPVLALHCVLVNMPQHENIESLLKRMILDGELYNVDVKKMSEGKCHVEVPSVFKKIKDVL